MLDGAAMDWTKLNCFVWLSLCCGVLGASGQGFDNVAQGKTCAQSSYWSSNIVCGNAINGNTGGTYSVSNCIHTRSYDDPAWWEVDLGSDYPVYNIKIWARTGFLGRLEPFEILVDGQLCASETSVTSREFDVTCSSPINGRVVRLERGYSWNNPLNMCEFEVRVCVSGYYGAACQQPCSDITTGCRQCTQDGQTCTACHTGYSPPQCTDCSSGYYKSNGICTPCNTGCLNGLCDTTTGYCSDCINGRFGDKCDQLCSQCYQCYRTSGVCTSCRYSNFALPSCTDCEDGYYQDNGFCSQCSSNCKGRQCDKTSGRCYECINGRFGDKCDLFCSRCYQCDQATGVCSSCFYPNFALPSCTECSPGFYIDSNQCSECTWQCYQNATCDGTNGNCDRCPAGTTGNRCQQPCGTGLYGQDCVERCGNCSNGDTCHPVSGRCDRCQTGLQSPFCKEPCPAKTYGDGCSETCGSCSGGQACDVMTGECPGECAAGYNGTLCQTKCPPGTYGLECNKTCGNCAKSSVCLHDTGTCQEGCASGYGGSLCVQALRQEDDSTDTGTIVGAVVGVVVVLAIIAVVVIIFLRRRKRTPKSNGFSDVAANDGGSVYENASGDAYNSINDIKNGSRNGKKKPEVRPAAKLPSSKKPEPLEKPLSMEKPPSTKKPVEKPLSMEKPPSTKKPVEKPAVVKKPAVARKPKGDVYENVDLQNRPVWPVGTAPTPAPSGKAAAAEPGPDRRTSQGPSPGTKDGQLADGEEAMVYANEDAEDGSESNAILLSDLQAVILHRLRAGTLEDEFKRMTQVKKFDSEQGRRKENYYKNRFNSILPYDKTRVKLEQVGDDDSTDYINANYIKGHKTEKAYIAAQGPKVNTQDDFWRMVWQEGVTDIVMLTNLTEGAKAKCYEYWPGKESSLTTDHMEVTTLEEEQRAHFAIRTFSLRPVKGGAGRQVRQYHYRSWLDHEVPATTPLVNFWRYVSARAPRSATAPPLVVHCSAGVGRTGTYVALDIIISHALQQSSVDINSIVDALRDDRCSMVQNKDQYDFLHEAVLEAYRSLDTRYKISDFDRLFQSAIRPDQPVQALDQQWQTLTELPNSYTEPSYTVAKQADNRDKNRNPDILPDDKHVVYLTEHMKGRSQYINAVYAPTFLDPRGSILTQLPLPNTLVDIWRLIDGCDVNTVVSIGDVDSGKDACCYWPRTKTPLQTGKYTVSLTSTTKLGTGLTTYHLDIVKEGDSRTVRVLHYSDWLGETAGNVGELIDLLQILQSPNSGDTPGPVLLQCRDGLSRSGLLLALWDAFSRMACDGEVDVFLAVRQLHTVRPNAVSSKKQWYFCYEVIRQHQSSQNVYANT